MFSTELIKKPPGVPVLYYEEEDFEGDRYRGNCFVHFADGSVSKICPCLEPDGLFTVGAMTSEMFQAAMEIEEGEGETGYMVKVTDWKALNMAYGLILNGFQPNLDSINKVVTVCYRRDG